MSSFAHRSKPLIEWFRRHRVALLIVALVVLDVAVIGYNVRMMPAGKFPLLDDMLGRIHYGSLAERMRKEVAPADGFRSKIVLGDLVPRMVQEGIIDIPKFEAIYEKRGGMTEAQRKMLFEPSEEPLHVTADNAGFLLNLLWPLGMSNRLEENDRDGSIGGTGRMQQFASTGGWTLGQKTGNFYYNQLALLPLTPDEEQRARRIAESTYRPCCGNSTFFQDCNHGSGAMALIELGVKQGLSDDEIYRTILAFNGYWFTDNYTEVAMLMKATRHLDWSEVDPREVLSKDYSSGSGWFKNVNEVVSKFPEYEKKRGGQSCAA